MLNALLHRYPGIAEVPRAGIVHRLDKDTTGLMVVAKTIPAQTHLVEALQARQITREYEAIAIGHMTAGGTVDAPIGRHPTQRTHYGRGAQWARVRHPLPGAREIPWTHRLRLRLETGRTHQIRAHTAHIKHPLVGIRLRRPSASLRNATPELTEALRNFHRQALHATMLKLAHPITGEVMEWHSPTPQDMGVDLMEVLRADTLANPDDLVWNWRQQQSCDDSCRSLPCMIWTRGPLTGCSQGPAFI